MFKFLRKLSGIQLWAVILTLLAVIAVNEQFFSSNSSKNHAVDSGNYTSSNGLSQETDVFANEEAGAYTVREYNGTIAVFAGEDPQPIIKENVSVKTLPEDDQKLLTDGIKFDTYREMIEFLQNYE
jgi:hypothetical protein